MGGGGGGRQTKYILSDVITKKQWGRTRVTKFILQFTADL